MVLLVFAAHDTTSDAMAMTFKMLAQYPTCRDTLLQEHAQIKEKKGEGEYLTVEDVKKMKYSWQVVRKTMRLSPPIFGFFRKAVADIDYGGFTIPKGWKILWTTYGTHYNPEIFQDPMSFDPTRFDKPIQAYTYLPFGGGPRLCAGHQLAKSASLCSCISLGLAMIGLSSIQMRQSAWILSQFHPSECLSKFLIECHRIGPLVCCSLYV